MEVEGEEDLVEIAEIDQKAALNVANRGICLVNVPNKEEILEVLAETTMVIGQKDALNAVNKAICLVNAPNKEEILEVLTETIMEIDQKDALNAVNKAICLVNAPMPVYNSII